MKTRSPRSTGARRCVVRVACALLERRGRVLAARRGAGMDRSGRWEFPGGKIRPGETPDQCVARELREELDIEVRPLAAGRPVRHAYPDMIVELVPVRCSLARGALRLREHAEAAWLRPEDMAKLDWTEADLPLVRRLTRRGTSPRVRRSG